MYGCILILIHRHTPTDQPPPTKTDAKEATLAGNRWGGTNFRIMGIKTAMKIPKEEPCELMVIVTPGCVVGLVL